MEKTSTTNGYAVAFWLTFTALLAVIVLSVFGWRTLQGEIEDRDKEISELRDELAAPTSTTCTTTNLYDIHSTTTCE